MKYIRGILFSCLILPVGMIMTAGCASSNGFNELEYEQNRDQVLKNIRKTMNELQSRITDRLNDIEKKLQENRQKIKSTRSYTRKLKRGALQNNNVLMNKIKKLKKQLNSQNSDSSSQEVNQAFQHRTSEKTGKPSAQERLRMLERQVQKQR